MARSGINKFHVQQARDALLAKGQHPSLDAVRIQLGNTGSKSTIHRFIRELEEEEGARLDDHALLSDTLKNIVGRLASQLHNEAQEIVARQETGHLQQLKALQERLTCTESVSTKCTADLAQCQTDLERERSQHQLTAAAFHTEQLRVHRLEQEVLGLKNQLGASEKHQTSLEDKHQHARETLEHYRGAIKDQREQEQRRHEQQLQQMQAELRQLQQTLIIKQSEVTESSKDNARLAAELSETRKQLTALSRELKDKSALLAQEKEKLIRLEQRMAEVNTTLEGRNAESAGWQAKIEQALAQRTELQKECQRLLAKLEAQERVFETFKSHLLKTPVGIPGGSATAAGD